jgi:methionyl-tRNA formyltransferase
VNWDQPAEQIEREIRAFMGWPKSRTTLGMIHVTITGAHVVDNSGPIGEPAVLGKQLVIYCRNNALAIDQLKPAGKQEMSPQAFLAGYKQLILPD